MFIKNLDYLSPPITIYYKGDLTHSSIISGILSIISVLIIIILGVYFSIFFIKRTNLNAFYYNCYVPNAGFFEFNSSSLFHFINIMWVKRAEYIFQNIDFTVINIIGIEVTFESYMEALNSGRLSNFNHWIYGNCHKDIHGKGVEKLIT